MSRTHGMRHTPTYRSWVEMRQRCSNPNHQWYHNYGGKGVSVCDQWIGSFEAFYRDMGERPEGTSIDRIDSDGNYELENCRWATRKEQARNRKTSRSVTYRGERMLLAEAIEFSGLSRKTVESRIYRGWPEAEWFRPLKKRANGSLRRMVEKGVIKL